MVRKAVQLNRQVELVALKLLRSTSSCDPRQLSRFRREAELGALMDSPAILPTYEFGRDGEVVFFTTPLVYGYTVGQVLEQRRQCRAGKSPLMLHRLVEDRSAGRIAWAATEPRSQRVPGLVSGTPCATSGVLALLEPGQAEYDRVRMDTSRAPSERSHPCAGKIRSREIAIGKAYLLHPFYP